jgi:hypothetical protein
MPGSPSDLALDPTAHLLPRLGPVEDTRQGYHALRRLKVPEKPASAAIFSPKGRGG